MRYPSPKWSRTRIPLLLFLTGTVAAGLVVARSVAVAPSPADLPEVNVSDAPCGMTDGVKAPLRGLVTIGSLPKGPLPSYVGGLSVNVPWAELQPTPGGPLLRAASIETAIEQVRLAGSVDDCPRGVKVRVLTGVHSPQWAKELSGPPIDVSLQQDGLTGTAPRFWEAPFGRAYDALQKQLAERFDAVPEVREVVISRCMTFYAEPLLRQVVGGGGRNLAAAGLDDASDKACQAEQIDAHAVWQHTRSSLALNPYIRLNDPTGEGSLALPLFAADQCRAKLGQRCILANNSIRWPPLGRRYLEMYEAMVVLGPPLEFQTAAGSRIGDLTETLRWAIDRQASNVEIEPRLLTSPGVEFDRLADEWARRR